MTDVFISYSRTDAVFVRELHAFLTGCRQRGLGRLGGHPAGLASGSRTSTTASTRPRASSSSSARSSLASEYCGKEFEHALKQGKRIVPIACESADENDAAGGPAPAELDLVPRRRRSRRARYAKLTAALDTDLEWARAHTRLLVSRGRMGGRARAARSCAGSDLKQAEARARGERGQGAEADRAPAAVRPREPAAPRRGASGSRSAACCSRSPSRSRSLPRVARSATRPERNATSATLARPRIGRGRAARPATSTCRCS